MKDDECNNIKCKDYANACDICIKRFEEWKKQKQNPIKAH